MFSFSFEVLHYFTSSTPHIHLPSLPACFPLSPPLRFAPYYFCNDLLARLLAQCALLPQNPFDVARGRAVDEEVFGYEGEEGEEGEENEG